MECEVGQGGNVPETETQSRFLSVGPSGKALRHEHQHVAGSTALGKPSVAAGLPGLLPAFLDVGHLFLRRVPPNPELQSTPSGGQERPFPSAWASDMPEPTGIRRAPRFAGKALAAPLSTESHCAAITLLSFLPAWSTNSQRRRYGAVGSEASYSPPEPAPALIFGRCLSSRSPAYLGVDVQPS